MKKATANNRINFRTTDPADAARVLRGRHGRRALRVASNRYDDALSEACAAFYESVMTEVQRQDAIRRMASGPPRFGGAK